MVYESVKGRGKVNLVADFLYPFDRIACEKERKVAHLLYYIAENHTTLSIEQIEFTHGLVEAYEPSKALERGAVI